MSNFLKQGKRKDTLKKVKHHEKHFFKLIGQLKELAEEINFKFPDVDINSKEDVQLKAKSIIKRDLDGMETIILINNLRNIKEDEVQRSENNTKEN